MSGVRKSSSKADQSKQRVPSAAEKRARARGFKGNAELAAQFAIDDNFVRETVAVKELPTPPPTEAEVIATAARRQPVQAVSIENALLTIFTEEAEEIRIRLERFGVKFTSAMQQDVVDHLFALLAMNQQGLLTGGGALARR